MNEMDLNSFKKDLSQVELKNCPEQIFYEGDIDLINEGRRVSVVGSRKVSELGAKRAKFITQKLVSHGITVVSGLAEGVDTIAHSTAIESNGKTIAVLGTPINRTYPKSNVELLKVIKSKHLAISQFQEGYPMQKQNFPRRNRTMALISDATIIIEASENSGTRHQGWEALRLGHLVYLMQNVAEDPSMRWPAEMIKYGAQVLTRENLEDSLYDIPRFSERGDLVF